MTFLAAAPPARSRQTNRRLLAAAAAGSFLSGANLSSIQVALPAISRHFGSTPAEASWTLLAYLVTFTVMVLVLGSVADRWGHRRMYLAGLGLFTLASVLCALSASVHQLLIMRGVQAVGAGAALCTIGALVAAAVPRNKLAIAVGINFTIGSMGQVIGPALGGLLTVVVGWQAVFWFNVPVGLAAIAMTLSAKVPRSASTTDRPFDILGAVLLATALGGLVLALSEGGLLGWGHPVVLASAGAVLLSVPLLLLVERRSSNPVIQPGLFWDRTRGPAYFSLLFLGSAYYGLLVLVSLYLQVVQGLTATEAGTRVLPMALGITLVTPLSGLLTAKSSSRVVATSGTAVVAVGLVLLAVLLGPGPAIPILMALVGVGVGLFQASNTDAIIGSVPANWRAVANGARQATQNTGYAIGTALGIAIVSLPLGDRERAAVIGGEVGPRSADALGPFDQAFRSAILAFAVLALVAVVTSAVRPSGTQTYELDAGRATGLSSNDESSQVKSNGLPGSVATADEGADNVFHTREKAV